LTPERWAQIEELFHRAAECVPEQRTGLLNEVCGSDSELRREVEALLSCDGNAGDSVQAAVRGGLEDVGFPLSGETISHYHILDGLGGGGMGLVYRAEDIRLGRRVALKFLPEDSAKDPAALGRFEREARSASALEHPNICPIYEFGEHEGQPFLVMQLLEGQTLRELISETGRGKSPLKLSRLLDLAVQILDGLDAAHQKGIIHRDIKPANIFVTRESQAKILDFGLAKLASILSVEVDDSARDPRDDSGAAGIPRATVPLSTPDLFLSRTGVAMGTAGYMSPEQVRGEKLDARTDLFSFGLVLYEMATGKRAFTGDTGPELQKAILTQMPSPARDLNPELPAKLEKIIGRALEKDREARYQSASEMRSDLQNLQREIQPKPRARLREFAAAGAAILFLAIVVFWFVRRQSASDILPPDLKLRQLTSNAPENPVTSGAISPDGKYLAYTDTKGIHVRLIETGETRIVPHPEELSGKSVEWGIVPQWFPDSTRFLANSSPAGQSPAYSSSQGSSIWIISVLGGPPHKLRDEATASSISPDGSAISFGTNKGRRGDRELWLMGPDGEDARKLYEIGENGAMCCLHWFPHGQRVWYGTTDKVPGGIVSRDLSGGPVTPIYPPSEPKTSWEYTVLPDNRLLFPIGESGAVGQTCNYWVMPLDERTGTPTEKAKRLTNWGGFCPLGTSVTADGKKLAFLKWMGHSSIYVADIEPNPTSMANAHRFAPSEGQDVPLDWTANGREIIFSSNRDGHFGIFKQPLDGDTAEALVTGTYDWVDARVSPDGAWLLYHAENDEDAKGPMHVMRMPVAGGMSQLVLTARPYSEFRCSRYPSSVCVIIELSEDRKQFLFTQFDPLQGRGAELARVDLDSEAKKLHWDLSPDGTRIAFTKTPQAPIEIITLRGNAPHSFYVKGWDNLDSLDWTPDGKGFLIADGVHGGMVLLQVDLQGNAKVVRNYQGGAALWARPSPDERHLVISEYRIDGNIWTLENF
jgi:eukaryotic-like serine/threonine-protein kinase